MMDAPAVLTEDRSRIEFQVRIRRKTLFYTVVLILPTVLMAFLNVTVFYLPTASGEKMGLTMNVLLSIVVFLLLVSKILPPTSSSIPLVAKYLLLTFVLNIITILITVIICNIYFRSPITHRLPPWVRLVFLDVSCSYRKGVGLCKTVFKWLPLLMCMQRPRRKNVLHQKKKRLHDTMSSHQLAPQNHHPHCKAADNVRDGAPLIRISQPSVEELSPDAQRAVDAIEFITENMKDDEITKQAKPIFSLLPFLSPSYLKI
ncbi:Neurotransmitter-gated ion-channel transmembrane region [Oesophagostomum dentatum]|uniref:Neurotransmitter-gated ion-channel transmembrane region n=1 Tax=Oesophagostomum dentatum TaxID=61180 RepID=A0A0B1S4E1_OESDE|nr:Neurotransmitter-gated ion-channel transmembrane region [Oesophagostomum dentatum]